MKAIERARQYSEGQLALLRDAIKDLVPPNEMVVINGSFARREASVGSDIDFYIVTCEQEASPPWAKDVKAAIEAIVPVSPAEDGAFAQVEHVDTLIRNWWRSRR